MIKTSNTPSTGGDPVGDAGFKPLTVTFQAAKQITGLGMTTLWALAKARRIEVVRVGRRTLIIFASLERLLEHRSSQPEAASEKAAHDLVT